MGDRRDSLTHQDTLDVHTYTEEEDDVITPLPHTSSSSGMGLADRRGLNVEPVKAVKRYSGQVYKVHPGGDSVGAAEQQKARVRARLGVCVSVCLCS